MQNSITNIFSNQRGGDAAARRVWDFDGRPARRLVWLYGLMLLPLFVVIGRVVHLQVFLPEAFAERWEWTTETFEPISSREGRILSADGTVLAYDTVHFGIWVHYRWLEDPANPIWLRRKALALLDRKDRRNREKIELAEHQVLAERAAMWQRLTEVADMSASEFEIRRQRIQDRVERIVANVERRRKEKKREEETASQQPGLPEQASWWQIAWHRAKTAVTTPPRRGTEDPLVLPEQQDYYELIENVPLAVAAEIESRTRQFPGLLVRTATDRMYPEHSLAAHVVGARTRLDVKEWKQRQAQFPEGDPLDYQEGERIGSSGVERSYDQQIRGLRGQRRIVKDRRGEVISSEIVRQPRAGEDVTLTINVPLQRKLDEILEVAINSPPKEEAPKEPDGEEAPPAPPAPPAPRIPAGGSIVVLDVHSGDVVAAVSAPGFDLNLLNHPDPAKWQQVAADPRRPFFPRATRMTLPPGSVFKPLSAIALLESGKVDPDAAIECHGYLGTNPNHFRCYHSLSHGPTTLSDALCRSCNVYFFTAADQIGPEGLVDWARRFGFGQPTGIDLPGEQAGNLPSPPSQSAEPGTRQKPWYSGDTRGLAIGQSQLTVTPIQIVRLLATIANDGYLVTPRVVHDYGTPLHESSGNDPSQHGKANRVFGLSNGSLERVREGLVKVVADPRGTGYKTVRMKEIAIAGKTGTAETGGGRPDHAWFAGYVPADSPRYAFVVVLEYAGSGGKTAGPVAHDTVRALLDQGLLETTQLTRREE
ncbi:MAG: penicillin-binding transpeptidase domain-containing protein [Planctomycetaceae bacterium]